MPTQDDKLWEVHRGDQPIVATAIHDGHDLRPELADLIAVSEEDRLREEDPYTARWTTVAANRVIPKRSRFAVDLNRPPDRAVYLRPEDAWGLKVWRRRPSKEVIARSMEHHRAFYDLMRALLNDVERQFGPFVVLDLHAYNHRREGPEAPPADPATHPVINVGTGHLDRGRWGALVDRFVEDLSRQVVAGEPLDVGENVRFQGGYLSEWVSETYPEHGCALAIEVKKIFMDEWTGEPDEEVIGEIERAFVATLPGLFASLGKLAR